MSFEELDGPSAHDKVNITSSTPYRLKKGATELRGRKVITIQALTGSVYAYFAGSNEVPLASDVQKGFVIKKGGERTYEASHTQWVYVLAVTGSVDISFAERS